MAETEGRVELADAYVVWSHEHYAWWRPKSAGYVTDIRGAGVYSRKDALQISHKCRDRWQPGDVPTELPVRVSDLPDWAADALGYKLVKKEGK